MQLSTGDKLGPYDILSLLGSGGMGEVYKARDTRLNRLVAIKVLRGDVVSSASQRQRFIQEAQAASALNHPNIVTVYDIFQQEGVDFLAMEYVAGKTLDALIPRSGMRLNEALRVAVQVADGLRKAHGTGIIHRDIKPSNIIVPVDGPVKILDFGLAKLTEAAEATGDEPTLTQRPETEEGKVMGTVAYMSPEQAEGLKVDVRTDVFSFGALLYEMVSGQRAFSGDSKLSTISAILKEDPKALEGVPADLEKIIRRCLRKDRTTRYQHMDDLKLALEEVREETESGKTAVFEGGNSGRRWVWALAVMVLAGVGGLLVWRGGEKPAGNAPVPVLRQVTVDPGLTTEPTVWAAGNMVAYASDRAGNNMDLWVQNLGTNETRQLTTNPADDREPAFSPDGSRIAFRSERDGGGIYVVPTLGGEERRIAHGGRGPSYSPDGKWITYYEGIASYESAFLTSGAALYIVPAEGGAPRRMVPGFVAISQAVWSPDGKYLLFVGGPTFNEIDWWLAPIEADGPVRLGARDLIQKGATLRRKPNAWSGNTIYFTADLGDSRNIWKVRIDPKMPQLSGPAERVTSGSGLEENATLAGERLIFSSLVENSDLWSLPIEPNSGNLTGELQRITEELAPNDTSSVDSAGRHVAFRTVRGGTANVVWRDLTTGQERLLTTSRHFQPSPRISPDGSRVAFNDLSSGKEVIQMIPAAGGPFRQVAEGITLRGWSADGRRLIVSSLVEKASGLLDLETGKRNWFLPFRSSNDGPNAPSTSPDDRWMVFYHATDNGRTKILLAPVRETKVPVSEWIEITDGQHWDAVPEFSPDGKTIYFLSRRDGFRCHWGIHLDAVTKKPAGAPFAVKHYHNPRRSPSYMRSGRAASAVARDKIVFTMAERTGNIWMTEASK